MKRSSSIALVATAVVLSACENPAPSPEQTDKLDAYQSKQECLKEWEESACEKRYDSKSNSLVWFGPRYYNPAFYTRPNGTRFYRNPHSGVTSRAISVPSPSNWQSISSPAVTSVPSVGSRGGFGGTSSSMAVVSSGG